MPSERVGPITIPADLAPALHALASSVGADDFASLSICATVLARHGDPRMQNQYGRQVLLASQLYEALKLELRASQRHESAKIGLLAAAIDQCRRAAGSNPRPAIIAAELGATLALLESGSALRLVVNGGAIRSSRPRPQLRLIEGGLSRSA